MEEMIIAKNEIEEFVHETEKRRRWNKTSWRAKGSKIGSPKTTIVITTPTEG